MNPFRILAAASIFESFMIFGSATSLLPTGSARLGARLRLNRRLASALARSIGLRIGTPGRDTRKDESKTKVGRLILANHTSVLDAIAIASLEDAIFVTSRDMAESLPIRWLATIAGATFIERRHRGRRVEELADLEALLRRGRTVVLFPEATSTNGGEILRFRNGLLHAAFRVPGIQIVPICLQYLSVGDAPVSALNRDRIFLYGEISVARHLLRIFTNPEVRLEARYFAPIAARDFEDAAALAGHVESLIRSVYLPIQ